MKRHKTFICRCNENRAYAVKSIQFFFFHATNMPPLFHTFIHFFLSNKVAVVYCIRFIYARGEEQKREDVLCKCFYQNVLCDILKVHQRASTCCVIYIVYGTARCVARLSLRLNIQLVCYFFINAMQANL